MGKVINTTNLVDSSTCLHVNLEPNLISDNYYLSSIQEKIDYEWEYRANKIDIKEEKVAGSEIYTDVQVVMDTVFDQKTKTTMSDDWMKLTFRDIQHNTDIGKRFLFSDEFWGKAENESVWLLVNSTKMDATASGIVRRCDNNIAMKLKDGTIHYEPCVLETEFKAINLYYDESIVVPQAQIYMILQYNEYTKKIKINDRYILGATDLEDRANNDVFRVKASVKFKTKTTFNVNNNKLVYLGLDRDSVDERDDLVNRVAYQATDNINPPVPEPSEDNYEVKLYNQNDEQLYEDKILLDEENEYHINVYKNGELLTDCNYTYEIDLIGTDKDTFYYDFIIGDEQNTFSIRNKRTYMKDKLLISCKITNSMFKEDIEVKYYFTLGGLS